MPHVKSKSFSTLPNFSPQIPTQFIVEIMTAHESLELDEHSAREVLA
ncbi:hypothetical protein ALC60_05724 [Trachymyrmex zeteki]|uniref:Uncharacterized protein n=1 Tax=Mycetomoellerius zeteki TaxID=64791 RepID=A0A151X4J9_9HYME|nr:hypothetical protein ALC60_05724 [Trachymyrmex zeteki]